MESLGSIREKSREINGGEIRNQRAGKVFNFSLTMPRDNAILWPLQRVDPQPADRIQILAMIKCEYHSKPGLLLSSSKKSRAKVISRLASS